ncbi:MAG: hypothetical protein KA198_08815 [Chitinophagaceae bacterium]|nr:hypothetical protein [Chitinophagaceae bacterium]
MNERKSSSEKVFQTFRASVDIAMGGLYLTIAFLGFKFPSSWSQFGGMTKDTVYIVCGGFALYGVYRIIKGGLKMKEILALDKRNSIVKSS